MRRALLPVPLRVVPLQQHARAPVVPPVPRLQPHHRPLGHVRGVNHCLERLDLRFRGALRDTKRKTRVPRSGRRRGHAVG